MVGESFVLRCLFCPMIQGYVLQQPCSDFPGGLREQDSSLPHRSLIMIHCHLHHVVPQECLTLDYSEPVTPPFSHPVSTKDQQENIQ